MPVARTRSIALIGMRGEIVDIEGDLGDGVPKFFLIGLPDAALGEAKQRVRAACANSGLDLPNKVYTVNLSPAALPKHGSSFDLGIALALLAAAGSVPAESVARVVHLGELGLDGRLRPVPGVLPAVLAAKRAGCPTVIVPAANEAEASLVDGIRVVGVSSLRTAALWHGAELDALEADAPDESRALPAPARTDEATRGEGSAVPDLADVVGNAEAVEALVVAAAGGHHLFLLGPPGAGKTMLAARLPGILPPLEPEAAIEVASVRSLSGLRVDSLATSPPFEAPHHSATAPAIVGGGSGLIRPGAIARAAHGVLFLDEAPEFSRVALDALRQPLESGVIEIHRANATARFPANFLLVLAANPCPCGMAGVADAQCACTPMARRRYLGRLSGPLLDRIDLQLRVRRISAAQFRDAHGRPATTSTAEAARRVRDARAAASARFAGMPWRLNAHAPGPWLRGSRGGRRLPPNVTSAIDRALERGAITMRGYDRCLRAAWTIADLAGAAAPREEHVGMALALRRSMGS